jgi:hypothetical protein
MKTSAKGQEDLGVKKVYEENYKSGEETKHYDKSEIAKERRRKW